MMCDSSLPKVSLPQVSPTIPTEKQDQIFRSIKKPKRKITHLIFNRDDQDPDQSMELDNHSALAYHHQDAEYGKLRRTVSDSKSGTKDLFP